MASFITITQAVARADEQGIILSADTIRNWASKGLGRKVLGTWRIDDEKYERVLSGKPVERIGAA